MSTSRVLLEKVIKNCDRDIRILPGDGEEPNECGKTLYNLLEQTCNRYAGHDDHDRIKHLAAPLLFLLDDIDTLLKAIQLTDLQLRGNITAAALVDKLGPANQRLSLDAAKRIVDLLVVDNDEHADTAMQEIANILMREQPGYWLGVEAIQGMNRVNDYWLDTGAIYVNHACVDELTILYDTRSAVWSIVSVEAWIEANHHRYS